ncbi:TPA_exp: Uncharacterized protein A8136_4855 [Trichophyton benhamiae CBS 112371]|uniref:Zn(2)-C6 fungal-type domain-containing protein n=1 Tax=Arthroderma benhamiae (strain ATCC MYA-4681 / CBS 112371) TaxID=663331 RepID=D4B3H6_ARTBC|nr:uncharacterized protein ARB_03015 [Trichophyton benhamiae CBS 112371]EFE29674.1 conserved hypothetical protein [Trichophyton benhamiae CBS 112371]DAA72930.1 TPA_exp: Uncharacterized protein A8136_4855 [Trichophyton benhamiae CBS 112371]
MASSVGQQLMQENEFDTSLALSSANPIPSLSESSEVRGSYQLLPAAQGPGQAAERRKSIGKKDAGERDEASAPVGIQPTAGTASSPGAAKGAATSKPKRVRTGCLTCRERHLKCDEAVPRCLNCQKSDRQCKRGIRLNFIDTQVAAPPYAAPSPQTWQINFRDESREIASEYLGGSERYRPIKNEEFTKPIGFGFANIMGFSMPSHQTLASAPALLTFPDAPSAEGYESMFQTTQQPPSSNHVVQDQPIPQPPVLTLAPPRDPKPYLNTPEEVLLMQVFVEEVGLWMDSMDAMKHFTRIIPFYALGEPMLLNALLACGARHLHLVNVTYKEEKALFYYNSATQDLLRYLQNPNRDSALSATTAVVLNVYEVMSTKATQRMNHIAGARALIKECRWDGRSTGVGGACFWLNVGMELLSCLHYNWKLAWDPDTWGVDMNMVPAESSIVGNEELWTHRIVYICAKVANYRTTKHQPLVHERQSHEPDVSRQSDEWNKMKAWCDEWERCIPRSMRPLGYLQPWQSKTKSSFPEVWLIKRSSVVARLFYHTTCVLLAKSHPTESQFSENMLAIQQSHANDICGIVAHVKDRGVASVSIRCLIIAAECLVNRVSQEQVLDIMDKILKETGWKIGPLQQELVQKWGWNVKTEGQPMPQDQHQHQHSHQQHQQPAMTSIPTTSTAAGPMNMNPSLLPPEVGLVPPRPAIPQGIVNPMMAAADFNAANHPYQNHYVAPQNTPQGSYQYGNY